MKFVRFDYSAGMCGTDSYEFGKFDDDITEEEISDIAEQICEQWCETYGVDIEAKQLVSQWNKFFTGHVGMVDKADLKSAAGNLRMGSSPIVPKR